MNFSQEGEYHSSGQFTLDSTLAWKKLQAYQVHEPARFACQLVAAAVVLGARWVDIVLQPKLARVHLRGCKLTRAELEGLLSRAAGHPLTLGLLGAQRFYPPACSLRVSCDGGGCRIQGETLKLEETGHSGVLVELSLGGGFFSSQRLNHDRALEFLKEECQDGVLPIEVNGHSLTRPVSLGDNLATLRLVHPDCGLPEFMGRAFEVCEMPSPGPFCGLIGCLSHKQETVISNGRVLLRRHTPGFSAFLFLLDAPLDLSGELVGGGQDFLDLLRTTVRRHLLAWTRRPDVPEAYRERLHEYWVEWWRKDPEGPLGEALEFAQWSGEKVALRDLSGVYVADWPARGPIFCPSPLLSRLFPAAVKLAPPPDLVGVSFESGQVESLRYVPGGERVEVVLSDPAHYRAALTAAQVLPPGTRWVTARPGPEVAGQLLDLLAGAARDPRRLAEVVGYLGWVAERFQTVAQKLLGLRMRLGGKISLPLSALDAVLGRADEATLAWLVDGGLLVGWGELERVPFLPNRGGQLVSLVQLQTASKVYFNQDRPDSLLLEPELVEPVRQFVGAVRR